jgi:dUTP pyrophosphatase
MLEIKIKYHVSDMEKIIKIEQGDWIDLRSAYDYEIKAGEFHLIDLGISVKIPYGYEMNIVPRSSTFKNWGMLQTNHFGVVDESYSGNEDIIKMPIYATRDTVIKKNDRVCQFRLNLKNPPISFIEVDTMEGDSRGGFGSTGIN